MLHHLTPHFAAFTALVGTGFQPGKLRPALTDQCVQPQKLSFEIGDFTTCTFHSVTMRRAK